MVPSSGSFSPARPGAPSHVVQGFFPGGRPRLVQASPAPAAPVRSQAPAPVQARPAFAPPAPILPGRPAAGALQPALRPGQPRGPIVPTTGLQPRSVQPATPLRAPAPQPIPPQAPRPIAVQPQAGNAFSLPANFVFKPRGSGQPLPEPIQKKMEAFFNTNFADVRVHVGHEAASIGALAFTHGTDLYFAPGQYNPQSTQGQQLIGHELTHVVQQRAGRVPNPLGAGVAVVQDPALEAEAERLGMRAALLQAPVQAKKAGSPQSSGQAMGTGLQSAPPPWSHSAHRAAGSSTQVQCKLTTSLADLAKVDITSAGFSTSSGVWQALRRYHELSGTATTRQRISLLTDITANCEAYLSGQERLKNAAVVFGFGLRSQARAATVESLRSEAQEELQKAGVQLQNLQEESRGRWKKIRAEENRKSKTRQGLRVISQEVWKMHEINQKFGYRAPAHESIVAFHQQNKTKSPGAAWMANQLGRKDVIGPSSDYIAESALREHLSRFAAGAHSFISGVWHRRIQGLDPSASWCKGWGRDYNFVAPLADANRMVASASSPTGGGLWELEESLGVPSGQWVRECEGDRYGIYRYIIKDTNKIALSIPSGHESQAYGSWWDKDKFVYGQWEPGGSTSGGKSESVIEALPREKLVEAIGKGLDIELDMSMAAQTQAVIDAGGWSAWKAK
jgi:hypothetical protein